MVRVRVPGGVCTPAQWLALDEIADDLGNGTLRLTTRQAFQFHGVIKSNLKRTMQAINAALLDTLAACGDVNRNVMCNPNPYQSKAHAAALELARAISDHLTPRTAAYHEIWLDGEKVVDTQAEEEPIYGRHYLPRKFKTVVAVPPSNDVDVFAQDLGFIAITERRASGRLQRHRRRRHGHDPRRARDLPAHRRRHGLLPARAGGRVAEQVVTVQRDYGDRADRKHARLKYTIEDRGLDWFRAEVERRLGYALEAPRPFRFDHTGDRYGWVEDHDGSWHYTLFVENGRVKDTPERPMKTGPRRDRRSPRGRLPPDRQSEPDHRERARRARSARIEKLLREHGLDQRLQRPAAATRWPASRCRPAAWRWPRASAICRTWSARWRSVIEQAGLRDDEIVIRMTGCPNGCARPYLAEIGLVGRTPGKYNLYLGAAFDGSRLNKLYRKDVGHDEIVAALTPLIESYAKERAARRALRRLRDPRGPRRPDHRRPRLPRQSGAGAHRLAGP